MWNRIKNAWKSQKVLPWTKERNLVLRWKSKAFVKMVSSLGNVETIRI
jgi:hypothetical protein